MTEKQAKAAMRRTAEKLHRAAYDYEAQAARYRTISPTLANALKELSSSMGNIARMIEKGE